MKIGAFELIETCGACPEQYDVMKEGTKVGYMRLRHGWFYADCGDKTVYENYPKGDGLFYPDERDFYLYEAVKAIEKELNNAHK